MSTTISGTPRNATSIPLKALPTRFTMEFILANTDCPRTMSSWGMMSSIRVLTAGEKNTPHREARNAAASTQGTRSMSVKASAPTPSIRMPRTTSMPTITHFRSHLSTMLPLKGDKNMVTNMEMEDMTPIRPLEPVFS